MIHTDRIKTTANVIKNYMVDHRILRMSVGLQTLVKVAYDDFIEAFEHDTTHYSLGNEIRIDMDGITYCAEKMAGVAVEAKDDKVVNGQEG